ncbi:hypothetical protein BSNT_09601 [Bacillus subtilis subsp. natto BEST195]|nr:hypothetical protein BSNT_09601 [Bacillus subtilis subsp. natto BEST195]
MSYFRKENFFIKNQVYAQQKGGKLKIPKAF